MPPTRLYMVLLALLTSLDILSIYHNSLRARNRFYQVVEAKRFEGVFLCRKVC